MRVLMTAGFDKASPVLALGSLLQRDGHEIVGVCVVSPFRIKRLNQIVRQRGKSVIIISIKRMIGIHQATLDDAPLHEFLHQKKIVFRSLKRWCASYAIPYHIVSDLNAPKTVEFVRKAAVDTVVYGGGGVLRKAFIDAANQRVLNAHSGPLPQVRGMNACEWSILLNVSPHVTIHFIDEGIDTGTALAMIPIPIEPGDSVERMRSKCVVAGVIGLQQTVASLRKLHTAQESSLEFHRQCYIMAPAIGEILEKKLARIALRTAGPA